MDRRRSLAALATTHAGAWLVAAAAACGSQDAAPPDPDAGDAGPVLEAGPAPDAPAPTRTVTVTTLAPRVARSSAGKLDPAWAGYRSADGRWHDLARTSVGTYAFEADGAVWAAAFACDDGRGSAVTIHIRPIATTALEVTLDDECAPSPGMGFTIGGTLANVPATTGWLDFGYPRESRGTVLPLQGTNAEYEEVNVDEGNWDLAFGLREDPEKPLERVLLKRGYANTVDRQLDLDMANALTPTPKKLDVHGLAAGEDLDISVAFATNGGFSGLTVGPQNANPNPPDLHEMYDALPASALAADDRYRVSVRSVSKDITRVAETTSHDGVDFDLSLPAAIPAPTATLAAGKITARLPTVLGATSMEALAEVPLTQKTHRAFRVSLPIAMASDAIELTPDFSGAPGFKADWKLPNDQDVTVSAVARLEAGWSAHRMILPH